MRGKKEDFSEVGGYKFPLRTRVQGVYDRRLGPFGPAPGLRSYIRGVNSLRAVATCYTATSPRIPRREAAALARRRMAYPPARVPEDAHEVLGCQ